MSSDLDELMSRDPLELTKYDIDEIIAYHRRNQSIVDAGGKVKRAKPGGVALPTGFLEKLLSKKPDEAPAPKPASGGLRRI